MRLPAPPASATGVVLAGGRSRRMGESKAALIIAGEPLLWRVTHRLQAALSPVLVVGPPELTLLVPGVRILSDLHPGIGPLAGLEAALLAVTTELAFVVACDMPCIEPKLIRAMVEFASSSPEADVVALARQNSESGVDGRESIESIEYLHAVYRSTCLPVISRQIAAEHYALHQLFAELCVRMFPPELTAQLDPHRISTLNANTPKEWVEAKRLAGQEPSQPE
jgi:molybdopterin-guanine dinucleotide biosynthesis protein A